MKYSNLVMDKNIKAEEGDEFEELLTGSVFIFHEGHWYDKASLLNTPSTPEKELSAAPIGDAEGAEPAPVEESQVAKAAAPKKKSTKKSTSKEKK